MQERGFASTRRTHQSNRLARMEVSLRTGQHGNLSIALLEGAPHLLQLQYGA